MASYFHYVIFLESIDLWQKLKNLLYDSMDVQADPSLFTVYIQL